MNRSLSRSVWIWLLAITGGAAAIAATPVPEPRVVHVARPELDGVIEPAHLPVLSAPDAYAPQRLIPNQFPTSPAERGETAGIDGSHDGRDLTFATSAAGAAQASAVTAFPAIDRRFDGPYDGGVAPPDSSAAVGRSNLVTLVNLRIAMYSKTGSLLSGPFSLGTFFGVPGGFSTFDPLAIYDPFADRFIVATLADNAGANDSRIYVAFSQTNDPTGPWNKYFIQANAGQSNNWADYASIGIDSKAVYFTANMFARSGAFSNVTLFIYNNAQGYVGAPLDHTHLIDVRGAGGAQPFRLRPAYVPEVVPGDEYYLAHADSSFGDHVSVLRLTGNRFAGPSLVAQSVPLPSIYFPIGSARQPGSGGGVASLGTNLWNVFYRNRTLWTAQCVNGSGQLAAWVHRINVANNPATREQTYQVEAAGVDTYFPYVVPDVSTNDFALSTAVSSLSLYSSGRYWNVSATGTVRYTENTSTGTRRNDSGRHGDYMQIQPDPVDRNRLWFVTQYMSNGTFASNTSLASVRFKDAPAPPPPVPDGKLIPGQPVRVAKATGNQVNVTWDTTSCPPAGNHLIWYDLAAMQSYTVAAETCAIGTSGSWTGAPPPINVGVIVVSDDNQQAEGSHGTDSRGVERPSHSAACGFTSKVTTASCP